MSKPRPVRGTHDLFGEEIGKHRHVEKTAARIAELYGYGEIATPIFEFTQIFARSLGDTSDVVTKEMYTFEDRGGESLTLRPENTAGVARALISNGLLQNLPIKLHYAGPMFRYERPQKGRMRQFHQIGVEVIGAPEVAADIEIIAIGHHILDALGIAGKTTLQLNSLGDPESRQAYRDRLVSYLTDFREKLSSESQVRLDRNPMRILDSKDAADREIVANAPDMASSMNQSSLEFFNRVQDGLAVLGIPFELNERLVRGLDYYTHTAFEFVTEALGAQGAVLAGGRYDGLVEQIGGTATPGVGWAAGVERLALLTKEVGDLERPLSLIPIGEKASEAATVIAASLRRRGQKVDLAFKGKPGARMKRADRLGASTALFLGDDELARGEAKVRLLDTGQEHIVPLASLEESLADMGIIRSNG